MSGRCELCGAKLYEGDEECRQCGTALGDTEGTSASSEEAPEPSSPSESAMAGRPPVNEDSWPLDIPLPPKGDPAPAPAKAPEPELAATLPEEADAALPDTNAITPPSMQAPVPVEPDEPEAPKSGSKLGLVVGVGAVALLAAGVAVFVLRQTDEEAEPVAEASEPAADAPSPEPPPSEVKPAALEPRDGCEQLEPLAGKWEFTSEVVTSSNPAQLGMRGFYRLDVEVDGCAATAEVTKFGYTGRWYKEKQVQHGSGTLEPAPHFGFGGTFDLRSEFGRGGKQELVFSVEGNRLIGMYAAGPRAGFLEGARDPGRRLLPALRKQPCISRCAMACNLPHREPTEATRAALQRCETTCAAGDPPTCGDTTPLPTTFLPGIGGPEVSLSAACQTVGASDGCRMNVRAGERLASSLRKLEGDWRGAQLGAAHGSIYLGLRTAAGWYAAGPVLGSEELTASQLLVRDLSSPRRYIVSRVAAATGEATAVCRLADDKPQCAVLPAGPSVVHPLARGTIALTGPVGDLEPGIYTW